jgi:sulfate adenylyltransferase
MASSSLLLTDPVVLADLEMLLMGGYAPLSGYMGSKDYHSVLERLRLVSKDNALWPLPICLGLTQEEAKGFSTGDSIDLVGVHANHLATLEVEEIYEGDLEKEFRLALGCRNEADGMNHPWAVYLANKFQGKNPVYLAGSLSEGPDGFHHLSFARHHLKPAQTRGLPKPMVGMQTRNPLHGCHLELLKRAMRSVGAATLLLQPVVGPTQPGDVPPGVRVKCYEAALQTLPLAAQRRTTLCLLPLAMRMAGPREALWHALIRKNYGCTHFVVGRDHAGPSTKRGDGSPWYGALEAQELCRAHQEEMGIEVVPVGHLHYVPSANAYLADGEFSKGEPTERISGTLFRRMLQDGQEIPPWFSPPPVISILKDHYGKGGVCVYFTGLSGAGKSTLAEGLKEMLQEVLPASKSISILDGDVIRSHLSKGLGFSQEDRSTNVQRIGYVCSEIVRHGGIVLAANIAPFRSDRIFNRALIEKEGTYIQVHVETPLNVCEQRDVKGLYAKVRSGAIKNFTGISSPYETPEQGLDMTPGDFVVDTTGSVEATLKPILQRLCTIFHGASSNHTRLD